MASGLFKRWNYCVKMYGISVFQNYISACYCSCNKICSTSNSVANNSILARIKFLFSFYCYNAFPCTIYFATTFIKEITKIAGGSGGGKPDMAQGGGKDENKISEALDKVYDVVKEQIKA